MNTPRPKSKKLKVELPNDGERMIPEYHKKTMAYGDHMARYESALSLVKDKVVLDIACGSGYGSNLLAHSATMVYGVDIKDEAIEYASQNFSRPNVAFEVGDGTAIPLDDQSVDITVSFETLEHIKASKKFLSEIKRVLKPNGQLILSTPNDIEFPKGNHFHVHEYNFDELLKLTKEYFKYIDVYFQATWVFTAIGNAHQTFKSWDEKVRVINTAPLERDQVLYFMLVCSNKPIKQPITPLGVISEHWSAKSISNHSKKVDKYIKDTIKHFDGIIEAKDRQIAELSAVKNKSFRRLIGRTTHNKSKTPTNN